MNDRTLNKIIFCYTGEPRSCAKGIDIRNKTLGRTWLKKISVRSHYLTCFPGTHKEKKRILDAIKNLSKDEYLDHVNVKYNEPENVYSYILWQKLDLLKKIDLTDSEALSAIIILTRTDWRFDAESLRIASLAFESGKIVLPKISNETRMYKQRLYKPMCDQFMAIPGTKLSKAIEVLKASLAIADSQHNQDKEIRKNILLGGDGRNRFGLGPEALLGISFGGSCNRDDYSEEEFKFAFRPGTFDACNNNLLRQDAGRWMKLNQYDLMRKRLMHYKGVALSAKGKTVKALRHGVSKMMQR